MKYISTTLSAQVNLPIDKTFKMLDEEGLLVKVSPGYGPFPGVIKTKLIKGSWGKVGAKRIVYLSNGGTAEEVITKIVRPTYFAYQVSKYSVVLKYLCKKSNGVWEFSPENDKTNIKWTYTFEAISGLAVMVLLVFVKIFYKINMVVTMREFKKQAEKNNSSKGTRLK